MQRWLNVGAVVAAVAGLSAIAIKNLPKDAPYRIVNVSYDPTRELYEAINPQFAAAYARQSGRHLTIVQSHGGSSRQARKVANGEQPADVVTLGLAPDIDSLRKRGFVAQDWTERLPNHAVPYTSTIVFVVRHGNPRGIKDWTDLLAPGLEIVMPDPRTSGNGKLAALAAWAAVTTRGGSESEAVTFLRALFRQVPVFDEGARGAALRFANSEGGDVHITWENEAIREVAESRGELDIVYPPVSILAEPSVAWIDSDAVRKASRDDVRAYLLFLFSDPAQETIARLGYRPFKPEAAQKAGVVFPSLELVPVTAIARDWNDAYARFFAEDGVIQAAFVLRNK
ncbi:sulfate ABC transporter substrate-binding protein [Bradyrhizobium sp. U87765 SZCCT0131]|nr:MULTISPECIES: sulfate ABC transporter substrate-binding protein [unclassified Bradyrhizobium]MBR1222191.1 sulfate ABC transporter substrate-binding protein [Bradyrhizobium sp. U87765 SZCCT0131]MBR1265680.1 sulfate ABC transporter substrate-binding protein [Bradyrhizobium sp. U87765 SZCCT0134]MBR1307892.1 sulfate ABC transporter substrate-binding protein [Bradyrhizobium sp. U87765 SZCCT0110]MBR1323998.1 sulfate ABC transporter substrate-binding protein [Bradyrhizobium sp. U87765 SZCCT0109]MB